MHVISQARLRRFGEQHQQAAQELWDWYKVARAAEWTHLAQVRVPFPSVDQVGRCLVFNVCHNKYRLIVRVNRTWKRLHIRSFLTHNEYDRGVWRKDCGD